MKEFWRSSTREDRWLLFLFLLPTTLFMVLLLWTPFLQGIYMSLHTWPFMGEPTWRGLGNYVSFVSADYFWVSLEATFIYSLSTLFQLVVAIAAALALKQRCVRFKSLWRGVMVISYAMPPVVVGAIWLFLLDPGLGMITHYLIGFGILLVALLLLGFRPAEAHPAAPPDARNGRDEAG